MADANNIPAAPEKGGPPNPKAAKPPAKPKSEPVVIRPVASASKPRRRHWGLVAAFLIIVCLPVAVSWWYLNERAVDQYASRVAFTVRSEDVGSAVDLFGGLGKTLGGGGSQADTDILYEFIRSQAMVAQIDADLGLRNYYSRHYAKDPVFHFDPDGTIEDLTDYWRMCPKCRVSYVP